ncbi:LCP family protein [Breznakiella homolactica]|uniref:LCP family protein n=1 Tax=Breznakiella homolactica TaxID=2798577 RepID=A0A7T7XRK3_9SPIR|nr:LCP family protein [Breznakiella homolactica]QQO11139.1 LCP family protein [Breznakiella homolactica]
MKQGKIDASVYLLVLIILLLIGGTIFTVFILRQDPLEEIFAGDRVINTLFIIEDQKKPLSSFVLLYYPATKRAAVFDIPGEVGLIIQQINRVDRIDTVYSPQKPDPYEVEIERLLGLDINFSVVFTLENFGKLVDLIEGIDIFIPSRIELLEEGDPILFPSGMVRLDGEKVRRYLAFRHEEEESEVVHTRRQRVFLGLIKRLGEQNEFLKKPAAAKFFHGLMRSDMSQTTRTRLFDELRGIDTDRVSAQIVTGNIREVSGQRLIFPYYDGSLIKEVVRQNLSSLTRQVEGTMTERVFTVEVLNGTPSSGLARRTADLLQGFGYDVITVGNADENDVERTEIIDRSGYDAMVRIFADLIRCQNIRSEVPAPEDMDVRNFEYKADFTLILGRDFNGRYVTNR